MVDSSDMEKQTAKARLDVLRQKRDSGAGMTGAENAELKQLEEFAVDQALKSTPREKALEEFAHDPAVNPIGHPRDVEVPKVPMSAPRTAPEPEPEKKADKK